jgi:hypothetical protein
MKKRIENAKVIDYRSAAMRVSDRARPNKTNFLAIGTAVAIMLGLLVYTISGYWTV